MDIKRLLPFLFFVSYTLFAFDSCPRSIKGTQLDHQYYLLSFRQDLSIAEWSCHIMKKEMLGFRSDRSASFSEDPLLGNHSPQPGSYAHSGYDRGHLVPAEDMSYSSQAAAVSFYMSNMTPQAPAFNRGIWLKAEEKMRVLTKNFGMATIVSGPILNGTFQKLPGTDIVIPQYFFKMALYQRNGIQYSIAYIIPNKGGIDQVSPNFPDLNHLDQDLRPYVTTVKEVQKATGLAF